MVLTVKLNGPVPDALKYRPTTGSLDTVTLLLSLVQIPFQDTIQRHGNNRRNDCPATEAPSPRDLIVEFTGNLWTGKGCNNVWRRGKGVSKGTIPQC